MNDLREIVSSFKFYERLAGNKINQPYVVSLCELTDGTFVRACRNNFPSGFRRDFENEIRRLSGEVE